MEVIDRDQHEAELARRLAPVFGTLRRSVEGNPALAVRDSGLWIKAERDAENALAAYLYLLFRRAVESFESSDLIEPRWIERSGRDWVTSRARVVATGSIRGTRDRVANRIGRGDFGDTIATEFGPRRIESISISEVGQTWSAAEIRAARELATLGEILVATWEIEDEEACPICFSLNGEPLESWLHRFPDGPPAHPFCRCRLRWARKLSRRLAPAI